MKTLDGKVALVTGAGQGVGQGIAYALATQGAQIAVAGRTESKLQTTCAEIRKRGGEAFPVVCDVTDRQQLQDCVAAVSGHFDALDILVNNAQIIHLRPLLQTEDRHFQDGIDSGPLATLRLMKLCHPQLKKNGGSIINLATSSALNGDVRGFGAYIAAKEAIRCVTRAAAHEWAADGIRVNCILPVANSPGMAEWEQNNPEAAQAYLQAMPLGRIGDCEQDIGRVVVFLCQPEASYVTAQSWVLDGGQSRLS